MFWMRMLMSEGMQPRWRHAGESSPDWGPESDLHLRSWTAGGRWTATSGPLLSPSLNSGCSGSTKKMKQFIFLQLRVINRHNIEYIIVVWREKDPRFTNCTQRKIWDWCYVLIFSFLKHLSFPATTKKLDVFKRKHPIFFPLFNHTLFGVGLSDKIPSKHIEDCRFNVRKCEKVQRKWIRQQGSV